ncbi:transcription factor IBH1-like [Amaranthus tricolor]|uniref:transcription factor IBH1-like n=1 Tax=Amaranthus tricolor TaxID=29722 RepID=UPI0025861C60|nr:transcription factor IBH1-like [Amaranthus tricolor]
MNPHHHHDHQRTTPLNLKSLRTRFAIRFLRALKKIQIQEKTLNKNSGTELTQSYHKVKVAADVSMAATVGTKRAWSRAILSRIRYRRVVARRKKRAMGRYKSPSQAQELRRLVPGGEAMDIQCLLDETAHYIKCLTTQVKVMRSIVNYCSN